MKSTLSRFLWKILLGCLFICRPVFASDANEITQLSGWQTAPSLPYAVQEIYPVFFEGHIVVAGGLSPDVDDKPIGVSDGVVAFNVDTQVWFDAPDLPEPRHHPMLVVVGDRLLSFGGFTADDNGVWHNSTDVLELLPHTERSNSHLLTNGTWQKIAQMPAPLAETLSAVHNGKVRLASGRTPKSKAQNSQWNDQTDVASHYTQATSRCLLQSYHSAFRTRHTCEGMWLPFEQV